MKHNKIILFVILFQIISVSESFARPLSEMIILSHRGVYQTYPRENLNNETCTAKIIYPPQHSFLENTIPSMSKAFEFNADLVEIDIHSTADKKIVVFHDWTLDCRTNEKGDTQDQEFHFLRSLDIGFGYTADQGLTHPFRCEKSFPDYSECMRKNQMPSLREVFQAFPNHQFVINMKSSSPKTLEILVAELKDLSKTLNLNLKNLSFYCDDSKINNLMKKLLPEIEVPKLKKSEMKTCLDDYFENGQFLESCKESYLAMTMQELKKLSFQEAEKLISNIHKINSKVVIMRVDSFVDALYLQNFNIDLFWTDRIDIVGPLVRFDRVESDLRIYDKKIKFFRDVFSQIPENYDDKNWIKQKLLHMYEVDQYMRNYTSVPDIHEYTPKERRFFSQEFLPRFREVDAQNTLEMKKILKIYDWIKISDFGPEADGNAWLLVQHADEDPLFQKEVLEKLGKLYKQGETQPANYAYLYDRVAVSSKNDSSKKLQRYGTQGMCIGPGKWVPHPMEDPSRIDQRRKEVGLGTLQEYIDIFKEICK